MTKMNKRSVSKLPRAFDKLQFLNNKRCRVLLERRGNKYGIVLNRITQICDSFVIESAIPRSIRTFDFLMVTRIKFQGLKLEKKRLRFLGEFFLFIWLNASGKEGLRRISLRSRNDRARFGRRVGRKQYRIHRYLALCC